MNLLITGGAGFIGSNFTKYWHKKYPNDNLFIFDKLTYAGRLENLTDISKSPKYNFIKGDVCNLKQVEDAVTKNKIDLIVHFAAESHVDRSIENPDEFIQTNIIGTFNILEIVKKYSSIRFHHISTDEVFGDLPIERPELKFTEDSAYHPNSPYSASKASSDHLVRSYINTYKIPATISNCSNNFGPYCYPEKLIPLVITRALKNEAIPVYGTGEQVRDWIHTEDHSKGIDLIINKGNIGETYLLGGDGERSNIYVVKNILNIIGVSDNLVVHVGDRKGHDKRYAIDFSKASTQLGFKPERTFEERLKETIEWYINNENWWKEIKKNADKIAEKYLKI